MKKTSQNIYNETIHILYISSIYINLTIKFLNPSTEYNYEVEKNGTVQMKLISYLHLARGNTEYLGISNNVE